MNTEESRQPKKQKKIIRWLLGLMVVCGLLIGLVSSIFLAIAIGTKEYYDELIRYCVEMVQYTLFLYQPLEMREAWDTGERTEAVDRFEAEVRRFLEYKTRDQADERIGSMIDDAFLLVPDGEGGYRYGGGVWKDEQDEKAWLSPADDLPDRAVRILRENEKKGCLMLNLKNGRESTVNVDLVCCGFGLPSTGTGYFCVVPAYRSLYQSTDLKSMNGIFFSTGLVSLALYILLLAVVALLLRRRIVRPIAELERSVKDFITLTGREPDPEKWTYEQPEKVCQDEIGSLSDSVAGMAEEIRSTTVSLLSHVKATEKRAAELDMAAVIQREALPSEFPAFPERKEFEIYASMNPAREVGGDFYDFFMVDDDHLGIVIADVSDKGMPAALFMMASKILIRNYAMVRKSPKAALEAANRQLCEGNNSRMFVSVWLGILDLRTGLLTAVNAGHEYPVLKTPGDRFELYKDRHGLVLGVMDGVPYKEYEIIMEKGEMLFVYTDGVPEAIDARKEQFGTDRLTEALNSGKAETPQEVLRTVNQAVNDFVKDAPQFDDLTMLCIKYNGPCA